MYVNINTYMCREYMPHIYIYRLELNNHHVFNMYHQLINFIQIPSFSQHWTSTTTLLWKSSWHGSKDAFSCTNIRVCSDISHFISSSSLHSTNAYPPATHLSPNKCELTISSHYTSTCGDVTSHFSPIANLLFLLKSLQS